MSVSTSKFSLKSYKNKEFNEYRCPKCSTIPFIAISTNENKLFISTKCTNDHCYLNQPFDEMKKMCIEYPIKNFICVECENSKKEKNKKKYNINYYCSSCYQFFCIEHGDLHGLNSNHKTFIINENFDNICYEHKGNSVIGYCINHNKNYCMSCCHFAENNKKVDEEMPDNEINKFENEMNKNKTILEQMENF